ncbi:MAG: Brp/Blh family beta-carotene 15,15'-dioxygenase [Natronomonas sp.]
MGVTVDRPRPVFRAIYDRLATRPAWTICALFVVGATVGRLLGVTVSPTLRYLPLAASVVVFGLPHGAVDYLVPARMDDDRSRTSSMVVVGALYAVVGGAYAALWLLAPLAAAGLFIAMTWFHWGQGDVHALVVFVGADHLDSTRLRAATGFVRGGLPMFVPLLAFPDRYRTVVEAWVGLFGADLSVAWLFAETTRLVGGAVFLAATVVTLAVGYRRDSGRGWRVDAGETALLWLFFLTVPPLVAIGVYFCVWHALRHVIRVVSVDGDSAADARGLLGQFAREAAPLTALALVFLVGFGLLLPTSLTSVESVAAVYLVFIAILTLPHVAVVTWMDRREGVWWA